VEERFVVVVIVFRRTSSRCSRRFLLGLEVASSGEYIRIKCNFSAHVVSDKLSDLVVAT
jgi:hypothetical protein